MNYTAILHLPLITLYILFFLIKQHQFSFTYTFLLATAVMTTGSLLPKASRPEGGVQHRTLTWWGGGAYTHTKAALFIFMCFSADSTDWESKSSLVQPSAQAY